MTKFCKDCKWSTNLGDTPRHPASKWACGNEKVGSRIDVVDGERIYQDCHGARSHYNITGDNNSCGPEGKLWEAKS